MKTVESDIRQFMTSAEQKQPLTPTVPDEATRILRAKLIFEEALEQCRALGVDVLVQGDSIHDSEVTGYIGFEIKGELNLVEVADSTADQVYVSVGAAIACGVRMEKVWNAVHGTNMAKFGDGSFKREDGKHMKPPGWVPPTTAIRAELIEQGAEAV